MSNYSHTWFFIVLFLIFLAFLIWFFLNRFKHDLEDDERLIIDYFKASRSAVDRWFVQLNNKNKKAKQEKLEEQKQQKKKAEAQALKEHIAQLMAQGKLENLKILQKLTAQDIQELKGVLYKKFKHLPSTKIADTTSKDEVITDETKGYTKHSRRGLDVEIGGREQVTDADRKSLSAQVIATLEAAVEHVSKGASKGGILETFFDLFDPLTLPIAFLKNGTAVLEILTELAENLRFNGKSLAIESDYVGKKMGKDPGELRTSQKNYINHHKGEGKGVKQ
jgi:cbb3-type cytochrome oxidase subunit 3